MPLELILEQLKEAAEELIEAAGAKKRQIFVLGCSTSEVLGSKIGTEGSKDLAAAMFNDLKKITDEKGLCLAVQCCEHLNRAIVVERETAEHYNLTEVTVKPMPHAGGAMASVAYEEFKNPVVVEKISAHLGIDIGQTLIGMHLKRVAVPVRLKHKYIGEAVMTAAKTRSPLIGGVRAQYPENGIR
ncbi:MAG: TIGR01440 family protein [Phascolarctobacterium sp.]|nr:TIGR01440 family protein [Phascolarctobacterium sp.]